MHAIAVQVKVKSLVGKTVGLYFSAHWCPPCRGFTPVLTAVYDELKGRGEGFEIVFVSADEDQAAFDEYYGEMPWLALPFEDSLQQSLAQYFDISGIPALVIIGADGKTVTTDARDLISSYGADAFPFTQDRVAELEERAAQEAPSLPDEAGVDRVDENEKQVSGTVVDDTAEYVCEGDVCRKV
jgi:nucleoredoxin